MLRLASQKDFDRTGHDQLFCCQCGLRWTRAGLGVIASALIVTFILDVLVSRSWVLSMKKRLTEVQFQTCLKGLAVGQRTIDIAHGVLVLARPQARFVASLQLSDGAVSQAVNRVWRAFITKNLPPGYQGVTVVLPEHQAFIVKKWAEDAAHKLASKK